MTPSPQPKNWLYFKEGSRGQHVGEKWSFGVVYFDLGGGGGGGMQYNCLVFSGPKAYTSHAFRWVL